MDTNSENNLNGLFDDLDSNSSIDDAEIKQSNTSIEDAIDRKFEEISHNVEMQSMNIGTQKISIPRDYNTINKKETPNNYTDKTEGYLDIDDGIKPMYVALLVVAVALFVGVLTFVVCRFTESNNYTYTRSENARLLSKIEGLEQKIEEQDALLSDSNNRVSIEEYDEIKKQLDETATKNDALTKEVEDLKQQLELTTAELKEQQFRADMFQKYGPLWER